MKNAWRMFVKGLIKSLIFMFFLFGIGVLSYKAVMHFLHIPEGPPKVSQEQDIVQQDLTTATVDDISKNLIFCVDEKSGDVTKLIVEIFHCADHKLYYITLPVRTQFTMSDTLYRELILVDPAIPQVIKLSGITNYFPEDKVYDYGVLLVEDLLKLKVSYYTVMPDRVYHSVFETEEQKENGSAGPSAGEPGATIEDTTDEDTTDKATTEEGKADLTAEDPDSDPSGAPKEIFSVKYMEYLRTLRTEKQVTAYLKEFYDSISSNLSVMDKLKYVESYLGLTSEDIRFEVIAGKQTNSAYIIDSAKAAEQLAVMTGSRQQD